MSKVTMWRRRWRCVIKPAYSFSFLLSINIFVWQNVLYFLDAPRTIQSINSLFHTLLWMTDFPVYPMKAYKGGRGIASTHSEPRHWMKVCGLLQAPDALLRERTLVPIELELAVWKFWWREKFFARTVQPVACRLSYSLSPQTITMCTMVNWETSDTPIDIIETYSTTTGADIIPVTFQRKTYVQCLEVYIISTQFCSQFINLLHDKQNRQLCSFLQCFL